MGWEIGVVACAIPLLWTVLVFNRLVRRANLLREGWSGVDVQLKRRHDLVARLVDVVRGHAEFERELLTEIAQLRTQSTEAIVPEVENALVDRVATLIARAENHPQLGTSESFLALHRRLCDVEEALQMARRYYNGTVRELNILVESFPSCIVARMAGLRTAPFFQLECASERIAPKVEALP